MSEEKESSLVEMKEPKGATRAITIGMFAAFGVFILALIAGFLPTFFGQKKIMKVADAKPLEIIYTVTQADYQNPLLRRGEYTPLRRFGHSVPYADWR